MKDDCMKNTEHSFLQINEKSHVIELQNIKPIISCFCRQHPILSEAVVEKRDSDILSKNNSFGDLIIAVPLKKS